MSYDASDKSLRRQAIFLQAATTIIVVGTVLNYLRTGEVIPFVFALFGSGLTEVEIDGFLKGLAVALPSFCYAGAVLAAGGIFGRVAAGEIFSARNSASLGAVGAWLSVGALVAMLVTPAVVDWFDLGALRFRTQPTDMLIAVIGGLIQMLGLVHSRATALRSELDQII
ncbi:hypothetical protein MCEMIH16_02436 [Caulobacteraceae bacterium]